MSDTMTQELNEEIDRMELTIDKLRDALEECAAELFEWVTNEYGNVHPSQQRRYDRDMEPVLRARALLKEGLE